MQPGRVRVDESAVTSLQEQFVRFNVFKIDTVDPVDHYVALEENAETVDEVEDGIEIGYNQSTSLLRNDVVTDDIQQDMSSAQR